MDTFLAEETRQDANQFGRLLSKYAIYKSNVPFLQTRMHGLIQLSDLLDAIWDSAEARQK